MENLVGRRVKCVTNGYCNFDLHQDYIIFNESETMYVVQDKFGECKDFPKHKFKYYFELLPNDPQSKKGDKVLYTDDLVNWEEGIFLVKHDESYIVESDEMLLYAIEIKPYEEEIKVGDWVKNTDEKELILVTKDMNLKCLNNESEYIKITNQQLIELLNNEL